MQNPEYKHRPVEDLIPYARNARTHSDEQVDKIAASIKEFGFLNPVIVDGENGIIAGHGRIMAAKKLGLDEVPTVEAAHLTDAQKRAYILADNRLALDAGWDDEMLRVEFAELAAQGFDLALTGFTDDEIDALEPGPEPQEGLTDEDEMPDEPEKPVTVEGDVWVLGNHRLMCGDSTKISDAERLCDGHLVDCCWTDPPYNVNYESKAGKIKNDHMVDADFRQFLLDCFSNCLLLMNQGAPIYVAHADTEGHNFRSAFLDAGFKLSGCLIWVKNALILGRSDYQWRHEPILYGWKPGAAHQWFGERDKTTVIDDDVNFSAMSKPQLIAALKQIKNNENSTVIRENKPSSSDIHPTMKPVSLVQHMLENSSKAGQKVLDLFGGGGSTLIACEKLQRQARLMELDPKYCDVIIKRWQDFTGQQAVHEETGKTFAEMEADRV